ncbi:MAG TPA: 2-phospho-L-lactate transferase CofD family protein, partial [Actinomycetota bacterium]|nr:2-phospho-L-lactate transferase CofD family protein [Actinomycetota bacterium]
VVCPSNPLLSIAPILALRGVREELARHPNVVAVTPIVQGAALKGPADRLLARLGHDVSAAGVARIYADFCDRFVVDERDASELGKVEAAGIAALAADTVMSTHDAAERLAQVILA